MNKRILLIMALLLCGVVAWGQSNNYSVNMPNLTPSAPQTAAFARYGEYPVSPATGIPQIDIPLYTIQNGDITVPVSISYHASGIKVEDVATPVGLGWSLNFGGVITRQVVGGVDKQEYTNNTIQSEQHAMETMQNPYIDILLGWKRYVNPALHNNESDRYIYIFNGKSGVFRYNSATSEIITVPYAPLKIVATAKGFKIWDTDGMIYTFEGGEENTLDGGWWYVSAWYVTKIELQATGRKVEFTYRKGIQSATSSSGFYSQSGFSVTNSKGIEYYIEPEFIDDCNYCNGTLNQRTVGLSHEFGHVILFLRGLPHGHGQNGVDDFVYGKSTKMSKRLGYDF